MKNLQNKQEVNASLTESPAPTTMSAAETEKVTPSTVSMIPGKDTAVSEDGMTMIDQHKCSTNHNDTGTDVNSCNSVFPISLPIQDGNNTPNMETRIFLRQVFRADDVIFISTISDPIVNHHIHVIEKKASDLDTHLANGKSITSLTEDCNPEWAVMVSINPVTLKESPSSYRYLHFMCEDIDLNRSYAQLSASGLPVSSVICHDNALYVLVKAPKGTDSLEAYIEQTGKLISALKTLGIGSVSSNSVPTSMIPLPGCNMTLGRARLLPLPSFTPAKNLDEWYTILPLLKKNFAIDKHYGMPTILASMQKPSIEEHPWIIDQILRSGQILEIVGKSKAGKSLLTLQAAISICCGINFLGHACSGGKKVLYVNLEISSEDFIAREIDELTELSKTHMDIPDLETWNLRGADLEIDSFIDALIVKVKLYRYDVVIIDPIYILFKDIDENDNSAATTRITKLQKLLRETGCACVIVHHESDKQSTCLPSGASAFMRMYDTLMTVDRVQLPDEFPEDKKQGSSYYRISLSHRNSPEEDPLGAWRTNLTFSLDETGILGYCDVDPANGGLDKTTRRRKVTEGLERLKAV